MVGTSHLQSATMDVSTADSIATPGVASDNPLDAPGAPRPQDDLADDNEDEDMDDAGDRLKNEDAGSEKDMTDVGGATDAEGRAKTEQPAQTKASMEASARAHLTTQLYEIVVPSYSSWFDVHKIQDIEKKALPEFFNGRNRSKTPTVYKDVRDFIVNSYRLYPSEYLTVTACRRNLVGDVGAISRVHAFLEQWGLINYNVRQSLLWLSCRWRANRPQVANTRPSNVTPPFTGHFRVTADTPRGMRPYQPSQNVIVTPGKPFAATDRALGPISTSSTDLGLDVRRNVYDPSSKVLVTSSGKLDGKEANGDGSTMNGAMQGEAGITSKELEELVKEPRRRFYCYSCGVDCTRVRYHSSRSMPPGIEFEGPKTMEKLKYDLCPGCYAEGRFPASSSAVDFIKLEDTPSSAPDGPWTDGELLLMLEALELYDEDWNKISDHVGTRTREQCALKFLQLDIEDKYLETGPDTSRSGVETVLGDGRLPISQADNPLLSVIAFLTTLSNQEVAAAAAGRSADQMRHSLRARLEKDSGNEPADDKPQEISDDAVDVQNSGTIVETGEDSRSGTAEGENAMVIVKPDAGDDANSQAMTTFQDRDVNQNRSQPLSTLATIPLALGAARASGLSFHEEREAMRQVADAVNLSLQWLELRLSQFEEMEQMVQVEREQLERGRQQLFLDRLGFKRKVQEVEDMMRSANLNSGRSGSGEATATVAVGSNETLMFVNADVEAAEGLRQRGGGGGGGEEVMRSPGLQSMEGYKSYDL